MKRQAETNVITIEVDESMSALAIIEHGSNPVDFHRTRMRLGIKSNVDLSPRDLDYTESSNVGAGRHIDTLYDIDAPQNAGELHRAVEVLTLLR